MATDPRLIQTRCLFVPCDSHGLQLLIKDILETEFFCHIHAAVALIISSFRSAPKQLALLRTKQIAIYRKKMSLILPVITRWGTEAASIISVYRSKEALKVYCLDGTVQMKTEVLDFLGSRKFWNDLEDLRDIISKIHKVQQMSESENSHIGHVALRWLSLADHFVELSTRLPQVQQLIPIVKARCAKQVFPIHWTVFYLDPARVSVAIAYSLQNTILLCLKRYQAPSFPDGKAVEEFLSFRAKEGPFSPQNIVWSQSQNPRLFWHGMLPFAPALSLIAICFFKTPCNSVPSERSFSPQNIIHTKQRNRYFPYLYSNKLNC